MFDLIEFFGHRGSSLGWALLASDDQEICHFEALGIESRRTLGTVRSINHMMHRVDVRPVRMTISEALCDV